MPPNDLRAKFLAIAHAHARKASDLELIEQSGDRIADYHRHVAWMDRNADLWRLRMEPPEFRTHFAEQDRTRRNLHELAISSTARLDRMADAAGLPLLFGGDTADRYAVALFAGDFTAACYEHGRSRRPGVVNSLERATAQPQPDRTVASIRPEQAPRTNRRVSFDTGQPEIELERPDVPEL